MCDGFWALLVMPSPKVQAKVLMVPMDAFKKFRTSGAVPDVVLALNWAIGALKGTVALTSLEKPLCACDPSYAVTAKW